MSFSVIVQNEGKKDIETSFNTQLFIDEGNDGVINMKLKLLPTLALKVGDTETQIWKGALVAKKGTHRAEVCADIDNVILEMNEKDNCASIIFNDTGNEINGDVVVEDLAMDPLAPEVDYTVSFSARVKNISTNKVSGSYAYLLIDDSLTGRILVSSLEGGGFEKVIWKTIWKASAGSHTYKVCADGKREVFETNEDNNCSFGTVQVK